MMFGDKLTSHDKPKLSFHIIMLPLFRVFWIILSTSSFGRSEMAEEEIPKPPEYYSKLLLNVDELRGSRWSLEQSSRITVYHAFEVIDITKVDVDGMSIRIEFFMRQRWQADGLMLPTGLFKDSDPDDTFISGKEAVLKSVWSPDSFIPNALDSKIASLNEEQSVVNIYKNKTITFKARMYSVLGCGFTFEWYPLDMQVCDLVFESYRYPIDVVRYDWETYRDPIIISDSIILYQYDIIRPPKRKKGTNDRWGGKYSYPYVKVTFKFERKLGNNLIQIFTPTILVTILSFFSFWLGLDAVPGRISLLITCILTIVTMHSSLKGSIPPVHYIKMMDIWMIGCMVFIFGAICEFIVVKYLKWRTHHMKTRKEEQDKYLKATREQLQNQSPTISHLQNMMNTPTDYNQHPYLQYLKNVDDSAGVGTGLTHTAQKRQAWQKSQMYPPGIVPPNLHPGFPGDFCSQGIVNMHQLAIYDKPQKILPPPSTPVWVKIDKVCRFLFPLLFAAFNGAYWPILLIGASKQHEDQ